MSNVSRSTVLAIVQQKQRLNPCLSPDGELGRCRCGHGRRRTPPPLMMHPHPLRQRDPRGGTVAPFQTRVPQTGTSLKNPLRVFGLNWLAWKRKTLNSKLRVGG
jgi:hypothetical protein